mgnify:FL=1
MFRLELFKTRADAPNRGYAVASHEVPKLDREFKLEERFEPGSHPIQEPVLLLGYPWSQLQTQLVQALTIIQR